MCLGAVIATLSATGVSKADAACPNESLRVGYAAALADCRGYELVSPPDKNGGNIASLTERGIPGIVANEEAGEVGGGVGGISGGGVAQSSPSGEQVTYLSAASFPSSQEAQVGSQYVGVRGVDGWSTQAISAPDSNSASYNPVGSGSAFEAFAESLSTGLLAGGENPPIPGTEAPAGEYQNLYLRDSGSGAFRALLTTVPPEPAFQYHFHFLGATSELDHIALETETALAPGAVPSAVNPRNMYLWSDGEYHLIDVLPGETETLRGPSVRLGSPLVRSHAISEDGALVFWEAGEAPAGIAPQESLMLRDTRDETTTQIDASQTGGVGGGGQFQFATPSGGSVYFTAPAEAGLTADTAPGSGANLYEYVVDAPEGGHLTDLTAAAKAEVAGVVAASQDGSYVYFVANGVLAPGGSQGDCSAPGSEPTPGATCNLYVLHGGLTTFIATLAENTDGIDWVSFVAGEEHQGHTARVGAAGSRLVFVSSRSLTGYDNTDARTGEADNEVYLYDVVANSLTCVSCNPSGAAPIGPSRILAGTRWELDTAAYESRVLSSDGSRVFFDSADALVPRDSNGVLDVYEWEADGTGSCQSMSQNGGCIYLISSGTSPSPSYFIDASGDGGDVFFVTRQQLVGGDTDELADLYDARIDGGFEEPEANPRCSGEGCKAIVPPAPERALVGTEGAGRGNVNGAGCRALDQKAKNLNKEASSLRGAARRAASQGQASRLRRKAARLARRAKGAGRRAKKCRTAAKGAGR